MSTFTEIREPAVAGKFYPSSATRLKDELHRFLCHNNDDTRPVQAIIVPHAGYQFSGPTAAKAFAALKNSTEYDRAVILAPSHCIAFRGIAIGNYKALKTPLGTIREDEAFCTLLNDLSPLASFRKDAHECEHSLEVELPFLQYLKPDLPVVPLLCGSLTNMELTRLTADWRDCLLDGKSLIIVSSDFTHFGHYFNYLPFDSNIPERLKELDLGAADRIESIDPEDFTAYVEKTGATICGRTPIALLLHLLEPRKSAYEVKLEEYKTSGDQTGDYNHSVSYAAFTIRKQEQHEEAGTFDLAAKDKETLLSLARDTIMAKLQKQLHPEPNPDELSETLLEEAACFVTLHINDVLRGCIGSLTPIEPLYKSVIRNAVNAAFEDPRFSPITAAEFEETDIEISVLSPMRKISGPDEFLVGKHGITMQKGVHRAVFLPQVAPEQRWDRETTLQYLSRKAGLNSEAWRSDTTFHVFEACVFGEFSDSD